MADCKAHTVREIFLMKSLMTVTVYLNISLTYNTCSVQMFDRCDL